MLQTRGPLGVPVLLYLYVGPIDISAHRQELKTQKLEARTFEVNSITWVFQLSLKQLCSPVCSADS